MVSKLIEVCMCVRAEDRERMCSFVITYVTTVNPTCVADAKRRWEELPMPQEGSYFIPSSIYRNGGNRKKESRWKRQTTQIQQTWHTVREAEQEQALSSRQHWRTSTGTLSLNEVRHWDRGTNWHVWKRKPFSLQWLSSQVVERKSSVVTATSPWG